MRVFRVNRCSFWYERGRVGGFPGLLSSAGAVLIGGCMTPPQIVFHGMARVFIWLGSGGVVFRFLWSFDVFVNHGIVWFYYHLTR